MLQTPCDFLSYFCTSFIINESLNLRFQCIGSRYQFTNSRSSPHKATLLSIINFCIRSVVHPVCAQMELWPKCLQTCCPQRFCLIRRCTVILFKLKALKPPYELFFNSYLTIFVNVSHKALLLLQTPHQN